MRNRRPSDEQQAAVAERLERLSAELAASDQPRHQVLDERPWWDEHTRIATMREHHPAGARVPDRPPPPPPSVPAPVVPVPGRHAARRRRAMTLPAAFGPAQLAVVAVLAAVVLALTCVWLLRSDPDEVSPGSEVVAAPGLVTAPASGAPAAVLPEEGAAEAGATSTAAGPGAGQATGQVTVHVAGKVRRPGIAVLDAGSRVVDALEAAGGPRPGVDLAGLNLARVLVDGEQILVGMPAPPGVVPEAAGTSGDPAGETGGPLVNLNTATEDQLDTLPEVGPVTAQAILAWRTEHGGFSSVEELLEVDGIGDTTLERIAPHVTV